MTICEGNNDLIKSSKGFTLKWRLPYSATLEGRFHLNSSPFSITLKLLLVAEASDSKYQSVVESLLETLKHFSSFFSFQFSHILSSFPGLFSFVWVLSSLEKVLHIFLYLQPSQLALQVSLQLYNFLFLQLLQLMLDEAEKCWMKVCSEASFHPT